PDEVHRPVPWRHPQVLARPARCPSPLRPRPSGTSRQRWANCRRKTSLRGSRERSRPEYGCVTMRGERAVRRRVLIAAAILAELLVVSIVASSPAAAADPDAPSTPKNLHVTSSSTSEVDLAWNASSDNVAVTAYLVIRDGHRIARVNAPKTTYADTS